METSWIFRKRENLEKERDWSRKEEVWIPLPMFMSLMSVKLLGKCK